MTNISTRPIVLYDGGCPLCSREINHYQRLDKRQAIQWCDITSDEQAHILGSLNIQWQEAMKHMHVIDRQGNIVKGAYAFKEMWLNLPYYRWPAQFLRLPLITPILNVLYNGFATLRWRSRKNDVCDTSCEINSVETEKR